MRRRISIFGSTGSIGCNTVDLIERQGGAEFFETVALTCGNNVELLAQQCRSLHAEFAVTSNAAKHDELENLLKGTTTKVLSGGDALIDVACENVDWVMSAIVGAAGLKPTMKMAEHAATLALANKESLVCAGALLLQKCEEHSTQLMPVDSEHSAIFQAIGAHKHSELSRVVLTASGGPFRTWSYDQMADATRAEALKHPNWDMGERITIDSASMFNKALEVIEAKYLFGVEAHQIEVVVHPQSIIHSMVEFNDGAIMAQLGAPDMRGPIGYALNYPDRADLPVERLDFSKLSRLDFEAPDETRFPPLRLAREALEAGGAMGAVLNAAKEIALDAFLAGEIKFLEMAEIVESVMKKLQKEATSATPADGINMVLLLDHHSREIAVSMLPDVELSKKEVV